MFIKKSNEVIKIKNTQSNHWKLRIQDEGSLMAEANNLVFTVDLLDMPDKVLRKHITKTHKNLAHKTEEQLLLLFKLAEKDDTRTRKTIKEVVDTCNICRKFKKVPPRPRVAMPKAYTSNEVVSMDLKEKRKYNKHILYCIDEFSAYIVGEVIPNKLPETIIEAFNMVNKQGRTYRL